MMFVRRHLVSVVVLLVAIVAWGRGGYRPWAMLVLELGGASLLLWLAMETLVSRRSDDRTIRLRSQAWKRVPFTVRHPFLGRWLTGFGLLRRRPAADVEIVFPGDGGGGKVGLDVSRELLLFGVPFRRVGLLPPLFFLSLWIGLSVVPVDRGWLQVLSPDALAWRVEAEQLAEVPSGPRAPWSLVPFLTLRSLWLWFGVLAVFCFTLRHVRGPGKARELALVLLLLGAVSGTHGFVGWVAGLEQALGRESESLRASGSFGNPNHYAAFQGMLLLASLGWLACFREQAPDRSKDRRGPWDRRSLVLIASLAILLLCLGLILTLSRSGISFAIAGTAVWALLQGRREMTRPQAAIDARNGDWRKSRRRRFWSGPYWALALATAGFAVWIGIEPLVGRFTDVAYQWEQEGGRTELWRDQIRAVGDYWLTGSGLSSFRYVGAHYRSFGGRTFYSWAHNDYLQLAIELGLPGLLLLAWLVLAVARQAHRVRQRLAPHPDLLSLHAGFVSALIAIALHSFTDFGLHLPANLALAAVITAVVVGLEPEED